MHAGADYLLTPNLLVRVGLQVDWTSQDGIGDGDIVGAGFLVGLYLAARLTDHLYVDGRAAWGRSFNDVSPFGTYTDDVDATRWLVSGALSRSCIARAAHALNRARYPRRYAASDMKRPRLVRTV